jgi:hypothetical protein
VVTFLRGAVLSVGVPPALGQVVVTSSADGSATTFTIAPVAIGKRLARRAYTLKRTWKKYLSVLPWMGIPLLLPAWFEGAAWWRTQGIAWAAFVAALLPLALAREFLLGLRTRATLRMDENLIEARSGVFGGALLREGLKNILGVEMAFHETERKWSIRLLTMDRRLVVLPCLLDTEEQAAQITNRIKQALEAGEGTYRRLSGSSAWR